ncbi:alpha/beta hydrolase fold domain-containing protein [Roseivivax sp.]
MSWQARLFDKPLRYVVKPLLARLIDPARAGRVDLFRRLLRRPPYLRHLVRPGGLHWISTGPCRGGAVILYFHGGGYVAGSPEGYLGPLGLLSGLAGIEVCAPRYRRAPRHVFPAAFEDARAAWDRLIAQGYAPGQIVLGGDSAGGGLALALLGALCRAGTPPRGAFAFSPWTDLALTGESLHLNAEADPVLPAGRLGEVAGLYLGGADPRDPRASALYGDFPGCPPVFLQYGAGEILRDDSTRMAARLRDFGAEITEEARPDLPHVWQLFDGYLPEARESLEVTAGWLREVFDAAGEG